MDWMDKGWLEFADGFLQDVEPTPLTRQLLKEAWLHGARTAIVRAQDVMSLELARQGPDNIVSKSRELSR